MQKNDKQQTTTNTESPATGAELEKARNAINMLMVDVGGAYIL
jgi:hypothetical protein